MSDDFRGLIETLRKADRLVDVTVPADLRHLPALIAKADGKAVMFHHVDGYDIPVVSGITISRENLAAGLDCPYTEIERRIVHGLQDPIEPRMNGGGSDRNVVAEGDDVDLWRLPVPLFADKDGGPMITAGLTLADNGEGGVNSGFYRYMIVEKNLTGIDLVTPNNLRRYADAAFAAAEPLPISINIGTHIFENMCATYPAPMGMNEMAFAGGFRGEAVGLTPCATIDVPCLTGAEIVLEAEILPTGWTLPEGRFGEFTQLMGGLHWNPRVRIKAVTMRNDPIYYALQTPWEVIWLLPPLREAALRRALTEAGVQVTAINVTPGSSCFFHVVIAIRKLPGDGKNAIMAALTGGGGAIKHVVIVDDDIDVFDPNAVEWAIATRVQADKDVLIVSGARAKPLDPSIPPVAVGTVPTTAKMGIDATIPDDVPKLRYQRITHPYATDIELADYLGNAPAPKPPDGKITLAELMTGIREMLAQGPRHYAEISDFYSAYRFQAVGYAISALHEAGELWQDLEGRLCLADSPHAAGLPTRKYLPTKK